MTTLPLVTAMLILGLLLGRGDASAGDWQPVALGTNLSMSGSTLNATGGGGPAAPVQLSLASGTVAALACSTVELYYRHDMTGPLTIPAFTGTCVDGQKVAFRLKPASGAALGVTFTTGTSKAFSAENGIPLPTLTLDSTQYVEYAFVYNAATDRLAYVGGTKATAPLSLADGGTGSVLADPGAHRLLGWDETENLTKWFIIGSGLSYDQATDMLSATGGTAAAAAPDTPVQFNTGGNLAGDADFTYSTTTDLLSVKMADKGGQVYNVRATPYNAVGNGINDDTEGIRAAYAAAGATGGILYFPPGTYVITSQIVMNQANVTWRGAGMHASVIKHGDVPSPVATAFNMLSTLAATGPTNPTFEDLGFDGNTFAPNVYVDNTSRSGMLTFRNCRFTRIVGIAVYVWSSPVVFDGNICEGPGNGTFNKCLYLDGPQTYAKITNNRMRYIQNGVQANTDGAFGEHNHNVVSGGEFSGNFVDLGFYTLRERDSGSGGTVTYGTTTLTDTSKTFAGFTTNDYIRVMPVKATGTGTIDWTQITGAGFTGVFPGDIVRSGGKLAIVKSVESATSLHVEEWLEDTAAATMRNVVSSSPNGTYTVYGVLLGKWVSNTATAITVQSWFDVNGTRVTPAAGTRYELLPAQPNYPFQCEPGCQDWRITNNTILRGYSDLIAYHGTHAVIADNYLAWGQDVGITLHGTYNTVTGNRIHHIGTMGIGTAPASDSTISNNAITDTTWTIPGVNSAAGIRIDGSRNVVSANVIGIETTMPQAWYGITVLSQPNDANLLIGNMTRGHVMAGIRLDNTGGFGLPTNVRKAHHVSTNEPAETSYDTAAKYTVPHEEKKIVTMECIADTTALTTGDGKCFWPVNPLLNGWVISAVSAHLGAAVSSHATPVNIDIDICAAVATGVRCTGTNRDLLTTNITIDQNEDGTETAAPAVISTVAGVATVLTGEWVRWNVDFAGTGAQGLYGSITLENNRP